MSNRASETNYRALYGKLFAALTRQFGFEHISEIEDAIQNSFLKSIKSWNPDNTPTKKESWLFITAKNDLLNQLNRKNKMSDFDVSQAFAPDESEERDLRLEALFLVAASKTISQQAKIIFALKNIFGLGVQEIADSTLLGVEAIYKMVKRAGNSLRDEFIEHPSSKITNSLERDGITIVENILYAVFNAGFDSFNEKHGSIVNKDLCLESVAISKILLRDYGESSTSNLLSLFCFHIARIEAKVFGGELVSFFNQNRELWNTEMVNLGFHYLRKPDHVNRFYIEALIVSKYMSALEYTRDFWDDLIKLYEILQRVSPSPIITINYSFCLFKAGFNEEAILTLKKLEGKLGSDHVYYSLLMATFLGENEPERSSEILTKVSTKLNQDIRKTYVLEANFINL